MCLILDRGRYRGRGPWLAILVAQAGMHHANSNSNGAHYFPIACVPQCAHGITRTGAGPGARRQRRCLRSRAKQGLLDSVAACRVALGREYHAASASP